MKKLVILIILLFTNGMENHFSLGQQPESKTEDRDLIRLGEKQLRLVFSDDFENGRDHWWTTDDTAWEIKSSNGNSTLGLNRRKSDYQPKHRSPHNIALIKNKSFKDLVIEFDVKSTKDTGNHRDCCVFFGYQDPDNFYYVHLGAKPDPASGQIMLVKNAPRKALTSNKKSVPWDDEWHKVRLTFNSDTGEIAVFYDDMVNRLMSVVDQSFVKGRVGVGSFDDMNDFDNVRVYSN